MDNHPKKEDQHRIEHPPFGRSQTYHRKVQGAGKGRSCFPRSEQRQLQQDTQRDRQTMRFQGTFDLPRGSPHERHDRTSVARRTHRNGEPPFGTHEHKDHPNLRQNHRPEDKPRHGNLVAQVGGYGEEYLPSHLIKNRIPMKEERNIITMDGQGNISLPSDIGATAMTEREICELFGVIAPTVRAGIKALCKSGVLSIYDIKRIIRISDKYSAEVYNLETIAALAFRVESFGAAKVRRALLERIIHGRKEKTTVFVSVVSDGKPNSRWKA